LCVCGGIPRQSGGRDPRSMCRLGSARSIHADPARRDLKRRGSHKFCADLPDARAAFPRARHREADHRRSARAGPR
jgi:hypothetical protein